MLLADSVQGRVYPVSHLREQASSVLITGTDGDDFQPRG